MAIQMKIVTNINDLTNRIALITGACSSLGTAMAQAFVAAGAYIVNANITPDPPAAYSAGESTVESINTEYPASSGSPRAAFIKINVAEPISGKTAVESTLGKYGRLNVMVNNAGVGAASAHGLIPRMNQSLTRALPSVSRVYGSAPNTPLNNSLIKNLTSVVIEAGPSIAAVSPPWSLYSGLRHTA